MFDGVFGELSRKEVWALLAGIWDFPFLHWVFRLFLQRRDSDRNTRFWVSDTDADTDGYGYQVTSFLVHAHLADVVRIHWPSWSFLSKLG